MDSAYGRFLQVGYVVRDIDAAVAALQRRMGAKVIDLIHDIRGPGVKRFRCFTCRICM